MFKHIVLQLVCSINTQIMKYLAYKLFLLQHKNDKSVINVSLTVYTCKCNLILHVRRQDKKIIKNDDGVCVNTP